MNRVDEPAAKLEPEIASDPPLSEHAPTQDFAPTNDRLRPVEDLHSLLLRISHHLDYETSERSTIYYRLLAIDNQTKKIEKQTKRRVLRALVRYSIAACVGIAAVLAWQSYGEATKQIVATRGPELGWSPEAKQTIANWIQQIGWTTPSAIGEGSAVRPTAAEMPQPARSGQTTSEAVAPPPPAAPVIDPDQVQQMMRSLGSLQQSVEQLASGQEQMAREIARLQTADAEILQKMPAPPAPAPQRASTAASKLVPLPPSRAPIR
jgi:negative regulator of sigma E activity